MNERLSELCDLEDPVPGAWTLEVSTPGLDRPLFSLEQCRRFLGRRVRVRHRAPDRTEPDRTDREAPDPEERRRPTVVGTIRSAESGILGLEGPEGPVRIEWRLVERVRLVPDFDALLGRAPAKKPARGAAGKPARKSAGKNTGSGSAGSGRTGGGKRAGNRRSARATGAAAGRRSPA